MENFDRPKKNIVREFVASFFGKRIKQTHQLLTLETSDWLFHKEMPNQKLKVYQLPTKDFEKMEQSKPKNIKLEKGDINKKVLESKVKYDGAYIDYCNNYQTNRTPIINMLKNKKFRSGSPIGFTFSTRLGRQVKNRIPTRTRVKSELRPYLTHMSDLPYKDISHGPMVTMLFEVK